MSLLAQFENVSETTTHDYDEAIGRLQELNDFPADGLAYHVAFVGSDGIFRVHEVWDSREQLNAYAKRLVPFLTKRGIELAREPEVVPIHNIFSRG